MEKDYVKLGLEEYNRIKNLDEENKKLKKVIEKKSDRNVIKYEYIGSGFKRESMFGIPVRDEHYSYLDHGIIIVENDACLDKVEDLVRNKIENLNNEIEELKQIESEATYLTDECDRLKKELNEERKKDKRSFFKKLFNIQ